MQSILTTIKKLLGIVEEYEAFDQDILVMINSAFLNLKQLAVGPEEGFSISSKEQVWTDFLPEGSLLEAVKQYLYLKVRITFDPPSSSFVLEAYNKQIQELEWRMNVDADKR